MIRHILRVGALVAAGTTLVAATAKAPADPSATPLLPISYRHLALPTGMQPLWPVFAQGGRDILFQNETDKGVWIIGIDGKDLKCLTCTVPSNLKPRGGGFVHPFPDGKRLLITDGVASAVDLPKGVNGWVLECAVSLRDCKSPRVLPVDMSADRGKAILAQRRTFHFSPDGRHIGWMDVRTDGTVMVVAKLERRDDRYIAADPRVVNPVGPQSPSDDNADRWENYAQLYELKSFTPDGRSIIAVGTPNNNVDLLKIELASGNVTRLTAHPDWDEDSSLSPDEQLFVVGSWRSQHRLDSLAWIPQIRGFTGLMTGAAIAPYYVSTWEGFQCDITPWLLPASGDDEGRRIGQPVAVYTDPTLTAANNVQGQRVWSPDSTMLLLHERLRTRASASPNRITIALLDRKPTKPVSVSSVQIGDWAPDASTFEGPFAKDREAVVRGRRGGLAKIIYKGRLGGGGASASVAYDRFTDDGTTFVSGSMSGAAATAGEGERRAWQLRADITVTGRHTGRLKMDLILDNGARPLPQMTGSVTAEYDGRKAPGLPALAPCYATQPKPSPLRVDLQRKGGSVLALITAPIEEERRPVMNATVRMGSEVRKTDASGRTSFSVPTGYSGKIDVTAGDTFSPAAASVP